MSEFLEALWTAPFMQYALLTGLMTFGTRQLAGIPSGWVADRLGWPAYFVAATVAAVPGLLLLRRYGQWQGAVQDEPPRAHDEGAAAGP